VYLLRLGSRSGKLYAINCEKHSIADLWNSSEEADRADSTCDESICPAIKRLVWYPLQVYCVCIRIRGSKRALNTINMESGLSICTDCCGTLCAEYASIVLCVVCVARYFSDDICSVVTSVGCVYRQVPTDEPCLFVLLGTGGEEGLRLKSVIVGLAPIGDHGTYAC
jgi:hypothetical protein